MLAQPVPAVSAGALPAGDYQAAVTFLDAHGDEGGTTEAIQITVPALSSLIFNLPAPPAGGQVRLYVGPLNGGTKYLQFQGTGTYICSSIDDSGARLDTQFLHEPVMGDFIEAHNSVLLIVDGSTLHMTLPLRPHLRSAIKGWYQFAKPLDLVASVDGGLYVAADKTYFLTDIETQNPGSKEVFPFGAVRGTATRGVLEEVLWMTQYGLAKSNGQGAATLISAANFVPELASSGSSSVVEHNGNQLVVTTLKGAKGPNPLAASDYYETEIITP